MFMHARLLCALINLIWFDLILHIFHWSCAKRSYFNSWFKIWRRQITAIRIHLRHIYDYLIFAWVFRTFWPKMGGLVGQNRGRRGAILIPNAFVLPFGGFYVCANFGENRSRNATMRVLAAGQIHWQTDRLTDALTDANWFYSLSHAICYSYGTDKNTKLSQSFNNIYYFWKA